MAQTVQILRSATNTPPPTLLPGALSVELGPQTKLWVGSASGNRLLVSSDPNDQAPPAFLPLAGGQMAGAVGFIPGSLPNASIFFGAGNTTTGLYGNANLVGILSGGQARFTVDNTAAFVTVPLTLSGPPTLAAHAATKAYVDAADATKLPLAGGTLTGPLTLSGPPTVALHTATKQYVDDVKTYADTTFLKLTGGTVTGTVDVARITSPYVHYTGFPYTTLPPTAAPASMACATLTCGNVVSNLYNEGADWKYLINGSGSLIVRSTNSIDFYMAGSGTAGAVASINIIANAWNSGDFSIWGSTASKPGGGPWVAPSSEEIKENISPYETGLNAILQLQPVTYTYTADTGFDPTEEHIGLVFEQVPLIETHKTAVIADGTEVPALDLGPVMFMLVNAMKEVDARLKALEGGTPAP